MTAPTITDDMRAWSAAYVASVAEVAAMRGEPIDIAQAERSIREALTTPHRWSAADDVEGDFPGWARAGSDRISDRWTEPQP
jgi:hypothetical protein